MRAVIVAIARNPADAQIWVDALQDDGIRASSFERGPGAALGGSSMLLTTFPVLVPEDRIGDARNVIAELGGASYLAPVSEDLGGAKDNWLPIALGVVAILLVVVLGYISSS